MVRYLSLLTFTNQGLENIQDSPRRAASFRTSLEAAGGRLLGQYWATGEADGCIVFEAPDEATAASQLLALTKLGNVRTRTMRLFDEREFSAIVSEL